MDLFEKIDLLVKETEGVGCRESRQARIGLYAEGLKSKLTEAEFAIRKLMEISGQSDKFLTPTQDDAPTIEDQVYFYTDAFFAFIYASLDVMAQFVNQIMKLKLSEDKTDFKKLNNKLQGNQHKNKRVAKILKQCLRSHPLQRLDKYRNCVLHRRHIYFNESIAGSKGSAGYAAIATGDVQVVVRVLCDNPYDIKPSINYKHGIPDFMIDMQQKITNYISQILDVTEPVR